MTSPNIPAFGQSPTPAFGSANTNTGGGLFGGGGGGPSGAGGAGGFGSTTGGMMQLSFPLTKANPMFHGVLGYAVCSLSQTIVMHPGHMIKMH